MVAAFVAALIPVARGEARGEAGSEEDRVPGHVRGEDVGEVEVAERVHVSRNGTERDRVPQSRRCVGIVSPAWHSCST